MRMMREALLLVLQLRRRRRLLLDLQYHCSTLHPAAVCSAQVHRVPSELLLLNLMAAAMQLFTLRTQQALFY
jgi:hypothetical protein